MNEYKVLIESWREEYNSPHSMMGYLPPASETIMSEALT